MTEFQSLIFYIVFFTLSVFFYKLYLKYNNKLFLIISITIPVLIGGLRYNVGTDYLSYKKIFEIGDASNPGMYLIMSISKLLNGNPITIFFLYNLATIMFVYLSLNDIDKKMRPTVLFLYYFMFYTTTFNIVKQGLALSIILYSYKYIKQRKMLKWLVFSILATIFHASAIICIPLYFIISTKSKKARLMYIILAIIVLIMYEPMLAHLSSLPLFSHFAMYTDTYHDSINNRMFYIDIIIYLYILLGIHKNKGVFADNNLYIILYLLGIILELTGFISPYVKRVADYFLITKVLLLPQVIYVSKQQKDKLLNYILIHTGALILFIITVYYLGYADVIPYQFLGAL